MRVIVVGDDPLARAGLANQLIEVTGLDVVAQIAADDSVTAAYCAYAPGLVLWDLGWSRNDPAFRRADLLLLTNSPVARSRRLRVSLPERPNFGRDWLAVGVPYRPGHSGGWRLLSRLASTNSH